LHNAAGISSQTKIRNLAGISSQTKIRNLAITNTSNISSAHKVTTVNFQRKSFSQGRSQGRRHIGHQQWRPLPQAA